MSQVCDLSAFYDIHDDVFQIHDKAFENLLDDMFLTECACEPSVPEKSVSDLFEYDMIEMKPESLMEQIRVYAADCWEVVSFVGDMILIRRARENVC